MYSLPPDGYEGVLPSPVQQQTCSEGIGRFLGSCLGMTESRISGDYAHPLLYLGQTYPTGML